MNSFRILLVIGLGILLFGNYQGFAQKCKGGHHPKVGGHPHAKAKVAVVHHHPNGKVVVRSHYRPKKMIVFHPVWGPKRSYNRRWVYFPRHNFYWDNWRQVYVYRSGNVWIYKPTPPPVVVNINIESEKHYELKENEDDIDDVYNTNDSHQTEYKPE